MFFEQLTTLPRHLKIAVIGQFIAIFILLLILVAYWGVDWVPIVPIIALLVLSIAILARKKWSIYYGLILMIVFFLVTLGLAGSFAMIYFFFSPETFLLYILGGFMIMNVFWVYVIFALFKHEEVLSQ